MRVKTIILFLIISTHSIAQDPIFSQADLNMLYVNPAYTGFSSSLEYQNRCFAHNRIQWNKKQYRKDLNTSYFEINLLPFKKQYSYAKVKNGETAVGLGLHVISQNILLNRMFENTEVGLSLSSINRLAKRWVGVGAIQANYYQRGYGNLNELVFTDQLSYYSNIWDPHINPQNLPSGISYDGFSFGFGLIVGWDRRQNRGTNPITLGFSINNIGEERKSISNPDNLNPIIYSFNLSNDSRIGKKSNRIKTYCRYITQIKSMNTSELGMIFVRKIYSYSKTQDFHPEFGIIYRQANVFDDSFMTESLVGILRLKSVPIGDKRKRNYLLDIFYSMDFNASSLGLNNVGPTYEIGISCRWRKGKICEAY